MSAQQYNQRWKSERRRIDESMQEWRFNEDIMIESTAAAGAWHGRTTICHNTSQQGTIGNRLPHKNFTNT